MKNFIEQQGSLDKWWLMSDRHTNPSSIVYNIHQTGFEDWLKRQDVEEEDPNDDPPIGYVAETNLNDINLDNINWDEINLGALEFLPWQEKEDPNDDPPIGYVAEPESLKI